MLISVTVNYRIGQPISAQQSDIDEYFANRPLAEDLLVEVLDENDLSEIKNKYAPDDISVEEQFASNPDLEQYIIE